MIIHLLGTMGSPYSSHLATPSNGATVKDDALVGDRERQSVHGDQLGSGPEGTGR